MHAAHRAVAFLSLLVGASCAPPQTSWTFLGGRIFDVVDGEVRDNAGVVVEDGVITRVLGAGDADAGAPRIVGEVVDCTGATLMPGLIESHGHLVEEDDSGALTVVPRAWELHRGIPAKSRAFLSHGITTVRDPGGSIDSLRVRNASSGWGAAQGPRYLSAGKLFVAQEGYPSHSVPEYVHGRAFYFVGDDIEQARADVRADAAEEGGVDFIKLIYSSGVLYDAPLAPDDPALDGVPEPWLAEAPLMPTPSLAAIVDEAHALGLRAAVHTDRFNEAQVAVDNGIDYLHHAWPLPDEGPDGAGALFLASLVERDVCWNLTLGVIASRVPELAPVRFATARRAVEAGVRLPMGSDTGKLGGALPWGESLVEEMRLHVDEAGMSVVDAYRSATIVAAECLGLDDSIGSITPGKAADLVVVGGNPVESLALHTPENVRAVWVGGELLYEQD